MLAEMGALQGVAEGLGGDTLTGHIDCVIISHFHLDHCGALPYMTEMVPSFMHPFNYI